VSAPYNFDRIADVYEETRRLPPLVLDGLTEQMASVFEGGRVLDAGVGTGRYAHALGDRDLTIVGLDVSRNMLGRARERGLSRLVRGDLTTLPFRDRAFDHTIAIHILHLVPDWRAMIREVTRVTSGYFASTLETREPDIHHLYDVKIGKGDRASPGIEEEDLAAIVPPIVRFPRLVVRESRPAEEYLGLLAQKTFSSQWDVPDDVHTRAMEALRAELAGKVFDSKRTWELVAWRSEDLRGI